MKSFTFITIQHTFVLLPLLMCCIVIDLSFNQFINSFLNSTLLHFMYKINLFLFIYSFVLFLFALISFGIMFTYFQCYTLLLFTISCFQNPFFRLLFLFSFSFSLYFVFLFYIYYLHWEYPKLKHALEQASLCALAFHNWQT